MLAELKTIANKKDVPYQSLAKVYLARQIALDRGSLKRFPPKKVNRHLCSKGAAESVRRGHY